MTPEEAALATVIDALEELSIPYVERWARELGVLDLWERIAGA